MRYERTFTLISCHFNDDVTYKNHAEATQLCEGDLTLETASLVIERLKSCMLDSHGHNFVVTVRAKGVCDDTPGFLVPDVALMEMIMDWDSVNLSVHPDFLDTGLRATTENMAMILHEKCELVFGLEGNVAFEIEVAELNDRKATYP